MDENQVPDMIQYERYILGQIVQEGLDIPEGVDEGLFSYENKLLFRAIKTLAEKGLKPDFISLKRQLDADGTLGDSKYVEFLASLVGNTGFASNIPHYIRALRECREKEGLEALLKTALQDLKSKPLEEVKDALQQTLLKSGEPDGGKRKTLWTAAELAAHTFEPVKFIVPGLIPTGLSILAGPPKLGKSWMALAMGIAVASGGRVFGKFPVEKAGVLYLALEDRERRLKSRMETLGCGFPEGLVFQTENRGLPWLAGYLKEHREIRLCIIDTWVEFSGKLESKSRKKTIDPYRESTEQAAAVKRLADDLDIAIVCVHHTRKTQKGPGDTDWVDSLMGSQGLAGKADTIIALKRGRGNRSAELRATGRDIEELNWVMSFDKEVSTWTYEGDKREVLEGDAQQSVFDWLKENGPNTPTAVHKGMAAEGASRSISTIKTLLTRMLEQGILKKEGALYSPPQ